MSFMRDCSICWLTLIAKFASAVNAARRASKALVVFALIELNTEVVCCACCAKVCNGSLIFYWFTYLGNTLGLPSGSGKVLGSSVYKSTALTVSLPYLSVVYVSPDFRE